MTPFDFISFLICLLESGGCQWLPRVGKYGWAEPSPLLSSLFLAPLLELILSLLSWTELPLQSEVVTPGSGWKEKCPHSTCSVASCAMPPVFLAVRRNCPHSTTAIGKGGFAALSTEILPTYLGVYSCLSRATGPFLESERAKGREKGLGE